MINIPRIPRKEILGLSLDELTRKLNILLNQELNLTLADKLDLTIDGLTADEVKKIIRVFKNQY